MFKVKQHEQRTLSWWYDEKDSIDFEPPYQRKGGVWTKPDQTFLIDSILNEFDIPKVYLADFTLGASPLNKRNKKYAVIDGRQRLEAIFGFLEGTVFLAKDFLYDADRTAKLGGLSFRDLQSMHPKIARKFENFNLSVMSVYTDDEAKINEMFVRLNRGRPLTGAEIRNAMKGQVPIAIRQLTSHEFFTECASFTMNRGQDKNLAAKLLLLEFVGGFTDTKKSKIDQFVKQFADEAELVESDDLERSVARTSEALRWMCDVFQQRDPLLRNQGPITVYYWLVRRSPPEWLGHIRAFLVAFQDDLAVAKSRLRSSPNDGTGDDTDPDRELVKYIELNRSTNDKGSLAGRYTILARRLAEFAESKRLMDGSGDGNGGGRG